MLVACVWFLLAGCWLAIGGSCHLILGAGYSLLDENLNNLTFAIQYRESTV